MKTFKIKISKLFSEKVKLGEVLNRLSQLDFPILADAALKGAVWHQKGEKGKIQRNRFLHNLVDPKDTVIFYFDSKILALPELKETKCLFENEHFGVWFKPAGILPQGTQYGDHSSLLRYVEKLKKREIFLVHRLDRETAGLMLLGYSSEAAARLSELFQKNKIHKKYEAIVLGEMEVGSTGTIEASLDDKSARTHYIVKNVSPGRSLLEVTIDTGRLHQIRRHLDGIGHPVMGDPKYGQGNKNREGLKLLARGLSFLDPWEKKLRSYTLDEGLTL